MLLSSKTRSAIHQMVDGILDRMEDEDSARAGQAIGYQGPDREPFVRVLLDFEQLSETAEPDRPGQTWQAVGQETIHPHPDDD